MSLLNDMLKDLDKKKHAKKPATLKLPALNQNFVKTITHKIIIITTLLLILFLALHVVIKAASRATPDIAPTVKQATKPLKKKITATKKAAPVINITTTEDASTISYTEQLNAALEALQKGEDPRAIDLLSYFLTQFPDSIEARENLSALYLSHNELSKAEDVLDEGLIITPYNLRLTIMKARVLVEEGQQRGALALLEPFHPDMHKSPEYYGLLAAIFESLNRTSEAGSLYQSLIHIDPANGQYWLGFGIALEHKNARQQAIEAYTRASQSENSQPAVRAYAENRLKILQG